MVEAAGKDSGGARSAGSYLIETLDRLRDGREVFFSYIRCAGDVMEPVGEPLTLDMKVKAAWERFERDGLADLPVVDVEEVVRGAVAKKTYIGLMRKRDLCAALSPFAGSISQAASDEKTLKEALGAFVTRGTPTLTPEAPLFGALAQMLSAGFECLPVVSAQGELVGSLTVTGLLKCFGRLETLRRARSGDESSEDTRLFDLLGDREKAHPTDMMLGTFLGSVKDVMDKKSTTLRSDDRIEDALRVFDEKKCEHVLVVDGRSGALQGIITENMLQLALPPIDVTRGDKSARGLRYDREGQSKEVQAVLGARLGTVMQARPPSLSSRDSIVKAADMLSGPDSVVVVAEAPNARPQGLVGRRDLIRVLIALGELAAKRGQEE